MAYAYWIPDAVTSATEGRVTEAHAPGCLGGAILCPRCYQAACERHRDDATEAPDTAPPIEALEAADELVDHAAVIAALQERDSTLDIARIALCETCAVDL